MLETTCRTPVVETAPAATSETKGAAGRTLVVDTAPAVASEAKGAVMTAFGRRWRPRQRRMQWRSQGREDEAVFEVDGGRASGEAAVEVDGGRASGGWTGEAKEDKRKRFYWRVDEQEGLLRRRGRVASMLASAIEAGASSRYTHKRAITYWCKLF